jgi:hypothetical protein
VSSAGVVTDQALQSRIAAYGGLGVVGGFFALLLGFGGVLRAADVDLGIGGWLAIAAVLALGLGAAAAAGAAHARRTAWHGAPAAKLARVAGAAVLSGLVAYGCLAMMIRAWQIILAGEPREVGAPSYDILLLVTAVAAGAVAGFIARRS